MKRILTIVAAALVVLTACNKFDTALLDGVYAADNGGMVLYVTLETGRCTAVTVSEYGPYTGVTTAGHYPNFTYSYGDTGRAFDSGAVTGFIIKARFIDADTFTGDVRAAFAQDNARLSFIYNGQFSRISANFQQTETGTN